MYKHMPTATGIKAVCGYFSRDYSLSVLSGCEVNVVGTVICQVTLQQLFCLVQEFCNMLAIPTELLSI